MKNKYLNMILMLLCFTGFVHAQSGGGAITLELKAYIITIDADGNETAVEVTETKPGDLIEYRLTCTNTSASAVTQVLPDMKVPAYTEYLDGSATPVLRAASLSLQQKNFQQLPLIRRETLPSGLVVNREVPAEEFRQLQWLVPSLGAGESVLLSARVKVIEG